MYFEEEQNQMMTLVFAGDGYNVRKNVYDVTICVSRQVDLPFFPRNSDPIKSFECCISNLIPRIS